MGADERETAMPDFDRAAKPLSVGETVYVTRPACHDYEDGPVPVRTAVVQEVSSDGKAVEVEYHNGGREKWKVSGYVFRSREEARAKWRADRNTSDDSFDRPAAEAAISGFEKVGNETAAHHIRAALAELDRIKDAVEWFVRLVTADPEGEVEWATIREWLDDFAGHVGRWRDEAADRDRLAAENERLRSDLHGFDRQGPDVGVDWKGRNGFPCTCQWSSASHGDRCPEHGKIGVPIISEIDRLRAEPVPLSPAQLADAIAADRIPDRPVRLVAMAPEEWQAELDRVAAEMDRLAALTARLLELMDIDKALRQYHDSSFCDPPSYHEPDVASLWDCPQCVERYIGVLAAARDALTPEAP